MTNILQYFLIGAMFATLGILGMGLVAMLRGHQFHAKYGNALMRWRVFLQAVAVMLFAACLLIK